MNEQQNIEAMTAEQVLDYLHDHPDFFVQYPAILTQLAIPDNHDGNAVSLIERQVIELRDQNQKHHHRLHELIDIAKQNESLAKRMHELVLVLLNTDKPQKLFNTLYEHLQNNFQADYINVLLFAEPSNPDDKTLTEFVGTAIPEQALFKTLIEKRLPTSGQIATAQHAFLFGATDKQIGSGVIVPLYHNAWEGLLVIGSIDAMRFQTDMGVELLNHLGEIISRIVNPWIKQT